MAKRNHIIGIDIGTTAVRVVQLKPGAKPELVTYAQVPVPENLVMSDSPADATQLSGVIAKLLKDQKIQAKEVVAGLPSSKLFASVINTPKLDDAQLAKAIRYQAGQYIPMPIDQVKLDWAVLGPGINPATQDVLLVAAPNIAVNKYVSIMEQAGLEIVALEANAIAASRALVLRSTSSKLAVMVADIGAFDTDLTLLYNGLPRLLRSVPVGINILIKSVGQSLGLNDEQARQFSFKFGLTKTKLEGQVAKAMKPGLDNLVGEIHKSIQFFNTQYPDVKLEKLILTGDSVMLPELPTFLANNTELPVEIGNAWSNISYPAAWQANLTSVAHQFAVAVGLAEREQL